MSILSSGPITTTTYDVPLTCAVVLSTKEGMSALVFVRLRSLLCRYAKLFRNRTTRANLAATAAASAAAAACGTERPPLLVSPSRGVLVQGTEPFQARGGGGSPWMFGCEAVVCSFQQSTCASMCVVFRCFVVLRLPKRLSAPCPPAKFFGAKNLVDVLTKSLPVKRLQDLLLIQDLLLMTSDLEATGHPRRRSVPRPCPRRPWSEASPRRGRHRRGTGDKRRRTVDVKAVRAAKAKLSAGEPKAIR